MSVYFFLQTERNKNRLQKVNYFIFTFFSSFGQSFFLGLFNTPIRNDLGIKQRLLNKEEILELEPNLSPVFDAGVIYDYAYHARDPHGIVKKIFELYISKGGKFIKSEIKNISQTKL